jgi:hypothetical protein
VQLASVNAAKTAIKSVVIFCILTLFGLGFSVI